MDSEKKPLVDDDEYYSAYSSIPDVVINQSDVLGDQPEITYVQNGITVQNNTQNEEPETKLYKKRWYVLMVFSMISAVQGGYWNTWGPIADSSEEAFGWTDGDIALLSNWGPIAYLVSAVFFSWVVDVKGLRVAVLSAGFLVAAGAGIRCITDKPPYVAWTVHTGQFLNGLGGPVAMGVPPAISSTWFPPHERTTATAIGAILNGLGVGSSFLIGPYMVSEKPPDSGNSTSNSSSHMNCTIYTNNSCQDKTARINKERKQIMKLLYVEAAFAAVIFLMVLLYFPAKPRLPPSYTASMERFSFKTGCKKLLGNTRFWMICLTYGVSLGVFNCWQSVLDVNLKPHNISENEAGWMGFYSVLASSASSLIVAKFADVFSKHMKFFLILLNVIGAGCMVWFTILINGFIPNSVVSLYMSIIVGTLLVNATPPLYFETACEVTYPVAEGVTTLVLTLMNNISGLIFLLVQMIPNIGTTWENWSVVGAILFCIPVLCLMKERYNRLEIDESHKKNPDKQ